MEFNHFERKGKSSDRESNIKIRKSHCEHCDRNREKRKERGREKGRWTEREIDNEQEKEEEETQEWERVENAKKG